MELTAFSPLLLAALGLLLVVLALDAWIRHRRQAKKEQLEEAPGPRAWPLLGSLHLLAGYEVPFAAFSKLAERYGDVIRIFLGTQRCIVVNGFSNIKEVLITRGNEFDGRPNFARIHQLFCGDKQNSLAFCDWSDVQKLRREMLQSHTFPRAFSSRFNQLDSFISLETSELTSRIDAAAGQPIAIKPEIQHAVANLFTSYFCSKRFDRYDPDFNSFLAKYDSIFYEVNQGCAADFLPWLMPFHSRQMTQWCEWIHSIRDFFRQKIVDERLTARRSEIIDDTGDYVSALLDHIESEDPNRLLNFDTALFALEDIIGGHAALTNLLVKTLGFVAMHPEIQQRVKEEADAATNNGMRPLCLADRNTMQFTDAVVFEAMRLISSPIVPHVANQDSSIAGYNVQKGSIIFLNNYELNMSPKLWEEPEKFSPERFLVSGRVVKPEHFLPFGGGRRSCMGYKIVQYVAFATLGSLLQRYRMEPTEQYRVPVGNLALPSDTFNFRFIPY